MRSPERLKYIMKNDAQGMLGTSSPFYVKNATKCENVKQKDLAKDILHNQTKSLVQPMAQSRNKHCTPSVNITIETKMKI